MYSFSPSAGGFFVAGMHPEIPADAVPVTDQQHAALMAAQAAGQMIVAGPDGAPIAVDPPAPPPPPAIRVIAPLAFRRRLSMERRQQITLAAAQALAATPPNAALQTWLDDLVAARQIDLDNPETLAGVALLQSAGLLTEAEAAALLADGTPDERP